MPNRILYSLDFCEHKPEAYADAVASHVLRPSRIWIGAGLPAEQAAIARALSDRLGDTISVEILDHASGLAAPREPDELLLLPEPDGPVLSDLLTQFIDRPARILAPVTPHYCRQRGLYVVTIPKSGSHMLYDLLRDMGLFHDEQGYLADDQMPQPSQWKSLDHAHTHMPAEDFFRRLAAAPRGGADHPFFATPAIFMYRNPCDIAVSEMNYYKRREKTALAYYARQFTDEQLLLRIIDEDPILDSLRRRMRHYVPWVHLPNVIPVSYEELVGARGGGDGREQLFCIWSLQLKLHVPGRPEYFAESIAFERSETFFKGKIGAHKAHFDKSHWSLIDAMRDDVMLPLGYDTATGLGEGYMPAHSAKWRKRPLNLTRQVEASPSTAGDVAELPYGSLHRYRGYILCWIGGRLFALPADVPAFNPQRDLVPAGVLQDMKTAPLLDKVDNAVRNVDEPHDEAAPQAIGAADAPEWLVRLAVLPVNVETYRGYNIVRIVEYFHAIPQGVTATGHLDDLRPYYAGNSIELAHAKIDRLVQEGVDNQPPRLIERVDYLEANIVECRGYYFGLPWNLGKVDVTVLPNKGQDGAGWVVDVDIERVHEQLMLQRPPQPAPKLLKTVGGCNLVLFQSGIFIIPQHLGGIDLRKSWSDLPQEIRVAKSMLEAERLIAQETQS